jgi:hypothetical protein
MKYAIGVLIFAAALVACASFVFAQTPVDPSGHWAGAITAPFGEVAIEVDLWQAADGRLRATLNQPAQNVTGLPLRNVIIDGRAVSFESKAGTGGGKFQGILFADGRTISGDYASPLGTAPFTLSRTGDAVVAPPLTSPAVGREMEGGWHGTLEAGGRQLRMVLTLANQPDGTALASVVSVDEGELDIPVAIVQKGSAVTLDIRMTGATYAATLSPDGNELTGTFIQGPAQLPLVLRRATR